MSLWYAETAHIVRNVPNLSWIEGVILYIVYCNLTSANSQGEFPISVYKWGIAPLPPFRTNKPTNNDTTLQIFTATLQSLAVLHFPQ